MDKLEQLKEELETNDIAFNYKDRTYVICPWGSEQFSAGPGGSDENYDFDGFDKMATDWLIEGKPLKEIINEITLL